MIDLIEYIVKGIVANPDDVVVTLNEESGYDNQKIYFIKVNSEDMGALIGKQGKTINSIRTIVKTKAKKEGFYTDLKIEEEKQ